VKRLHRAVLQETGSAPSVPNMYPSLSQRQIALRIGEVSMIAGQPGVGKSTLAMALAVRSKTQTLYMSADTHAHTQAIRVIAMLSGAAQDVVEAAMAEDRAWASEMLQQADYIRWSFDSAPTVQSIEDELLAHIELHGPPVLTVVDNLTDMVGDGTEFEQSRNILKDFRYLAREYGTAFLVLHHMSEAAQFEHGTCPPRSSLMGKVAQTPALILSIAQSDAGFLGVSPVKNRYGPANPSGRDPSWLAYDPACMQVTEVEREFSGF
jgi:hypothetical protein